MLFGKTLCSFDSTFVKAISHWNLNPNGSLKSHKLVTQIFDTPAGASLPASTAVLKGRVKGRDVRSMTPRFRDAAHSGCSDMSMNSHKTRVFSSQK